MNSFISTDWIQTGKKYADAPPKVRRAIKAALTIPKTLEKELLHDGTLRGLAAYEPPLVQATSPISTEELAIEYFSDAVPTPITPLIMTAMRRLPLPPKAIIDTLHNRLVNQAYLDGTKSVRYAHLAPLDSGSTTATLYPIWAIRYWKMVVDMGAPRRRWQLVSDWVRKHMHSPKSPEREFVAQQTWDYMRVLPWNKSIDSLDSTGDIHTLYRLLGKHWLATDQINDRLAYLTEKALDCGGAFRGVRHERCEFGNTLIRHYEEALKDEIRTGEKQSVEHKWLAGVGKSIAEGKTFITVLNLEKANGEPHWIALVVNGLTQEVLYGDPLGRIIPENLKAAIYWWLNQFVPATKEYPLKDLPISTQLDSYNCGFFALNAAENYTASTSRLAPNSAGGVANLRMEMFNTMANRIMARLESAAPNNAGKADNSDNKSNKDGDFDFDFHDETPPTSPPSSPFTFCMSASPTKESEPHSPYFFSPTKRSRSCSVTSDNENPTPRKKKTSTLRDDSIPLPSFSALQDFDDMPPLADVGDTDNEESDDEDGEDEDHSDDEDGEADRDEKGDGKKEGGSVDANEIAGVVPVTVVEKSMFRQKPLGPLKTTSLTSFFKTITVDELRDQNREHQYQSQHRNEERRAQADAEEQAKKARQQEQGRARSQRKRDRAREEKVKNGWVPKPGNFKKRKMELLPYDVEDKERNRTAEESRPYRQFKHNRAKKPCGRKAVNPPKMATKPNYFQYALWEQVQQAWRVTGPAISPREITQWLKSKSPKLFATLAEQTVGGWVDKQAKKEGIWRWRESVLAQVETGNRPHAQSTRTGILHNYPDLCAAINTRLRGLRKIGAPLTMTTIRGLMIAYIKSAAPEVFEQKQSDGSYFRCSESYVQKYLANQLKWSYRRATRAAKKVPENVDEVLTEAFLREAFIIRDHNISGALRVNTDQTKIVYQLGSQTTWAERGAKQVPTTGLEEKRAFTLVPSISASGDVLPWQAIYQGHSTRSCPSAKCRRRAEADELGLRLLFSDTDTYWSTHETMHDLADNIIAPYFDQKKEELGLDPDQHSLWKIDCWSVHKSREFLDWMKQNHPTIIILFVPANCTGLWQPLDVGIQRILKLAMKRSSHRDVVAEVSAQLDEDPDTIGKLDTLVGTLRDRSVGWIVDAINDVSDKELVQKAFELCVVGELNCSQSSLKSSRAAGMLRQLPKSHPLLYAQLIEGESAVAGVRDDDDIEPAFNIGPEDDSDIPIDVLADVLAGEDITKGFRVAKGDGAIKRGSIAETDVDDDVAMSTDEEEEVVVELPAQSRRGRTIRPNRWYSGETWERG